MEMVGAHAVCLRLATRSAASAAAPLLTVSSGMASEASRGHAIVVGWTWGTLVASYELTTPHTHLRSGKSSACAAGRPRPRGITDWG
eukprot:2078199-Prymnesium_polylepis.1